MTLKDKIIKELKENLMAITILHENKKAELEQTELWLRACDAILNGDGMKEQITAKELYEQLRKLYCIE